MTREEVEQKIVEVKWILERAERSSVCVEHIKKNNKKRLADLEKQLAELEVEVYRGWKPKDGEEYYFINWQGQPEKARYNNSYPLTDTIRINNHLLGVFKTEEQAKKAYDRHMAGEELKKLISEENAKQGWKVNWDGMEIQYNYYLLYDYERFGDDKLKLGNTRTSKVLDNELYFSEQSSKDQDFLDKIKPLWMKWKGIE